nr:MAG TPA: hypothetical protein [Caudoviricetes sp.]
MKNKRSQHTHLTAHQYSHHNQSIYQLVPLQTESL